MVDQIQQKQGFIDWKVAYTKKYKVGIERNNTDNYRKEHIGHIRHDQQANMLGIRLLEEGKARMGQKHYFQHTG